MKAFCTQNLKFIPRQMKGATMFWDKFYNLCLQNGISPNKAAKIMNISSGSVTEWKKGRTPQMKTVKKIADHFGVSTDVLLGTAEATITNNSFLPLSPLIF